MSKHGWTYKRIEEVCELFDSQRKPVTKHLRTHGTIPYYGANGIQDYVADYIFDGRYLLIGEDGARWGANEKTSFIIDGKSWVNNHAHLLKTAPILNDLFLMHYLNYKDLSSYITGTIVPKLTQASLKKISVPVPSKNEQEAIVAELDEINETIEALKQQVADLDALAQSTFYTMFGNPVTNEKGWEEKKLGELAIIGTGATPSRTKEDIYYNGNIPWVKTTEVHYEDIEDTEEKITAIAVEETNCKIYPEGTILMAMYGQGKTRGQIAKLKIRATTNQACAAIDLSQSSCEIDFIYCHLKLMYEHIRSMARGGNQANLNLSLVNSILIINPPLTLQQEFAAKVEAIESAKVELNAQVAEMQTLLASRMDYYFD